MNTSTITYNGNLRTTAVHDRSGNELITDAPTDNKGLGAAFSPTDLLASSLGSCMLTIAGIAATEHGFSIDGATCGIVKRMAEQPRRVIGIDVALTFPANDYSEKQKLIIEKAVSTCPVIYSLHPDIEVVKNISFL